MKKIRVMYEDTRIEMENQMKLCNLYLMSNYSFEKIVKERITLEDKYDRLTKRNVYLLIVEYDLDIKYNKHDRDENLYSKQENKNDNPCKVESEEKKHYFDLDDSNNHRRNLEGIDINKDDDIGNLEEIKFYSVNFFLIHRNL